MLEIEVEESADFIIETVKGFSVSVHLDFNRKSYEEDNLKPQDILTLMFSFKNIGSYKSTNLAVSENDKEDIEWESYSIDNDKFNIN